MFHEPEVIGKMSHDETLTETGPTKARGPAWAWATEHRAPERASAEQLLEWLASGELPPQTLVWKPGWGEWLPAMQVAEFAAAFPSVTAGSRRVARAADDSGEPPPVPVAHYPRLRLLARDVVGQSPKAPFASVLPGIAPAAPERRALRDLDQVQKDLVTSQVPAAAMLEAARAMKRLGEAAPGRKGDHWSGLDLGTFGEPLASDSSVPPEPRPLRTFSPLALELGLPSLLEPEPAEESWPAWSKWKSDSGWRRYGRWVAVGAFVGGALALFAIREPVPSAAPAVNALQPSLERPVPRPSVVTGPCRLSSSVVRLDEWALREVPPLLRSLSAAVTLSAESAGGAGDVASVPAGWVVVGYARSHQGAGGVALAPGSLELQRLVSGRTGRSIFSVAPLVRGTELTFHAEREGSGVAHARLLDVEPPARIGMNAQGVVAGPLGEPPQRVWELPRGAVIAVPAVAAHVGGFTLAMRGGRSRGPLYVGVMSERAEPLSELGVIGDATARFGRPALASGEGTTALAVVARSRDGARQAVWLSRASAGQPPLILQPFESSDEPSAAGRGELDAPALAALPGGGFALSFTQGHGWKRRVRLQRFSAALEPLDEPVDVTTPDRTLGGASAGALIWVDDRLLALYFRGHQGGHSLWGSTLTCELG